MLIATNPFSGEKITEHTSLTPDEIDQSIKAAKQAYHSWRKTSFEERAEVLKAIAAQLRKDKDKLAEIMALEMGKPVKEGVAEVEKAAWCSEHYAEHAQQYLMREEIPSDASLSYVVHQPLGTLIGILPWNAPLWLAFRYLAPALMAGNTCTLKHDPNVPGCAEGIMDAIKKSGAPDNIVVNLPIENDAVSYAIRHPDIAGVSFTGSSRSGAIVAATAASEVKPFVLELGGSDPCVVLKDADLETAANIATLSRIINAGQSCIAAKRIIVETPVYEKFVGMLKERLSKLKLGNPLDMNTDIGPIAREELRDNLHRQVTESIEKGAKCLLGGELPEDAGYFYPVTLLTDVNNDMPAFVEETFGPIMVVIEAKDANDALEIANDTPYGLGAAVWTADMTTAEHFANEFESGQVAINGIVKTDPRLPSGGIKASGIGRELGPHGIKEFVNAKQVWIK